MTSSEDRASAIRDAAKSILMTSGLTQLSFSELAKATGHSRQLVRYYYPDMDALMLDICDDLADVYRNALVSGASDIEGSARISFFLDFYFDVLAGASKPRDDQIYDAAFSYAAGSDPVRDRLSDQYGLLGQVVSHEIQVAYPTLNMEQCLELSYLFVCLMYGRWKMVASLGYSEAHNRVTRDAIDLLIKAYVQHEPKNGSGDRAWTKP